MLTVFLLQDTKSVALLLTYTQLTKEQAGHDALSSSRRLNAVLGILLHSSVLTPHYAWRITHNRHHVTPSDPLQHCSMNDMSRSRKEPIIWTETKLIVLTRGQTSSSQTPKSQCEWTTWRFSTKRLLSHCSKLFSSNLCTFFVCG